MWNNLKSVPGYIQQGLTPASPASNGQMWNNLKSVPGIIGSALKPKQASAAYQMAIARRLNGLCKEAMTKQALPGGEFAGGMAKRMVAPFLRRAVGGGAARAGADIADSSLPGILRRGVGEAPADIADPSLGSFVRRRPVKPSFGGGAADIADPGLGAAAAGGAAGGGLGGTMSNIFGRFAPHLQKGMDWAKANPGITGAAGGAVGGLAAGKGYDAVRDNGRRNAVAEAPFGQRLMMALQYMTNP